VECILYWVVLSFDHVIIILLSIVSGLTTLIGIYLATILGNSPKRISLVIGFSAGIMLVVSFLELLPESAAAVGVTLTLLSTVLGVLLVGSLDFILPHIHLTYNVGGEEEKLLRSALLITFGLILHDFPEGFAMANSYLVNPHLGLLITVAIAVHNIPEEFAMSIPLINLRSRRFIYTVAFLSGLSEPAGAILGLAASSYLNVVNPFFLSFSAGAMIFVSFHELIPMSKRYGEYSIFIVGFLLSLLVYLGLSVVLPG